MAELKCLTYSWIVFWWNEKCLGYWFISILTSLSKSGHFKFIQKQKLTKKQMLDFVQSDKTHWTTWRSKLAIIMQFPKEACLTYQNTFFHIHIKSCDLLYKYPINTKAWAIYYIFSSTSMFLYGDRLAHLPLNMLWWFEWEQPHRLDLNI